MAAKKKKYKKMSQLTEVHGMQNLDMKFKLHTMFVFFNNI